MVIGNPSVFAIESGITQAYESLSLRALGFFVIHVGGRRFGVYESDATMLANSYDTVQTRVARRGGHTSRFAIAPNAGKSPMLFAMLSMPTNRATAISESRGQNSAGCFAKTHTILCGPPTAMKLSTTVVMFCSLTSRIESA
jgi:hypothetical protein